MKIAIIVLAAGLPLVSSCDHQRTTQEKKIIPTVGFNHIKDVSPILDMDAYAEEIELKKRLPDNPMVGDKRAFHENGYDE